MPKTIIRNFEMSDLERVSQFIAHLNAEPVHHIAYFGLQQEEIVHYLMEERTCPAEETCLLAFDARRLVAVMCVEYDLDLRRAWLEGPLIDHSQWQAVAEQLYQAALKLTPSRINDYELAGDVRNTNLEEFAWRHGFRNSSDAASLDFYRSYLAHLPDIAAPELEQAYFDEFKVMHGRIFPGTYYAGYQLLDLLDDHHKAFAVVEDGELLGYAYAYVSPPTGSGYIDFIGVSQAARGKGIGYQLLVTALRWVFSFQDVNQVGLTANLDNQAALRLYKKAGFVEQRTLRGFRKKIDQIDSMATNR